MHKNKGKKENQLQTTRYFNNVQRKWNLGTTTKGVSTVFKYFIYLNKNFKQAWEYVYIVFI